MGLRGHGLRFWVEAILLALLAGGAIATFYLAVGPKTREPASKTFLPLAEVKRVKVATPEGDQWRAVAYYANSIGMRFVLIPSGEFMMGDALTPEEVSAKWPGVKSERYECAHPRHRVRLTRDFYMGAYEVTRGQFAPFVRATGYQTEADRDGKAEALKDGKWGDQAGVSWRTPLFEQTDDHPVVCVSWNDATAFCEWLSAKEGRHYCLPTEAEWEYAARAGRPTSWYWGDEETGAQGRANVAERQESKTPGTYIVSGVHDGYAFTAPVGSFSPNAFGLYDVIGNVWEWCRDWYARDYYRSGPEADPTGPRSGKLHQVRGGSWRFVPSSARIPHRVKLKKKFRDSCCGFRVVCELD